MAIDDSGEHVGEIVLRVDAVHFAGCDQRGQNCPMFGTAIGAGEEMVFAPERNGADGALDGVGIDLDAAIIEEAGEPVPARECISDSFRIIDFPETAASCDSNQGFSASTSGLLRENRTR